MSARLETPSLSVPQLVDELHCSGPDGPGDFARGDFTNKALAALAALDAHASDHLDAMLQFGEALSHAKVLRHGEFGPWCLSVLKRSPSRCSAHRRLYVERGNLERHVPGRRRRNTAGRIAARWSGCSRSLPTGKPRRAEHARRG